ncbi:MAG: ATP-binding protein [Acetobacteraceae bacterium]
MRASRGLLLRLAGQLRGGTLASLLRDADDRLAAAARVATERVALEARLGELHRVHEEAERNLVLGTRREAAWREERQAALEELNRPASEHPDVTADILAVIAELDREHRAAQELAGRVRAMQDDNSRFTASVEALLARVAPELAQADRATRETLAAIRALRKRLDEQRARAARSADIERRLAQSARHLTSLKQRLEQREADLTAVLAEIGAASVEDAEQRLALASERRAQAEKLARAEIRLREDPDRVAIEALREELAELGSDEVAAARVVARAKAEDASRAVQEAAARASRQKLEMEQRATDVAYQTATADQKAHVATIRRVLEEAIIARLAAGLLGRAMEKVEEGGGGALLARIGDYFRTLSGGAYSRVVTEDNGDGSRALTMVPSDLPDEQKRVSALSEGTRDQLYLALRLAAIQDHVKTAPALPFIGDDILQTSDDERATAALSALLEFSRHVQVILLTHHPHILRLAAALPGEAVHLCRIATQETAEA